MAASGPRTAAPEDAPVATPTPLSVTEVAAFVGLRQCGRYLRLSVSRNSGGVPIDASIGLSLRDRDLDKALAAAGRQLEDDVATELRLSAPGAPHLAPHCATPGAPLATPWADFLCMLSEAPANAVRPYLGCWAAEVVLRGRPTVDSVVSLSGRADFILLLWRGDSPVLRIVECKASAEPQTKFVVQLVLYRMLLLRLLSQESMTGRVRIGGREWSMPTGKSAFGAAGGGGGDVLQELQVECLLRTKVSGAAGHAVGGSPLPPEEVESMTRQLSAILERGGRIAAALDEDVPLKEVPYELDSHCSSCSVAPECWAESATRGAVQLSGCGASESQRLTLAGVGDIEELAALVTPPRMAAGVASSSPRRRRPQLPDVAVAAGMSPPDLERLSLTAAVRARRWLGRHQPSPSPSFLLLPGAPPSCLPCRSVRVSLVRVYLSMAVDVVLGRLVGVAAHVAAPAVAGSDKTGGGDWGTDSAAAPPQAAQAGWDVSLVLEGVALDATGVSVLSTKAELDRLEAGMLDQFSDQLCDDIQRCAERLGRQGQLQGPGSGAQQAALLLHFYVHSQQELRELIRRCMALDHCRRSCAEDGRSNGRAGAGLSVHGLDGGGGTIASGPGGDADLSWLPHLLGLRGEIGDLLVQDLEQEMVSVMEEEVRRYATKWQGAGRLAATSVPWGGDGVLYDWRVPPSLRAASAPGAVQGSDGGGGSSNGGAVRGSSNDRCVIRDDGEGGADLRAIFSAGGYLDSIVPAGAHLFGGVEDMTQREAQWRPQKQQHRQAAHTQRVEYVQVRPDCAGASIPPSFLRALWSTARARHEGRHRERPLPSPLQQYEAQRGPNDAPPAEGAADVFQQAAVQLRQLLLAQAHAVRWLEERMVRLPGPRGGAGGGGGNPRLRKVPLVLPLPLNRSLRSFRLDGGLLGGPRRLPEGPQVARASELARAALDAVLLNRGSELRQVWRGLGAQPPAVRAGQDRSGTVVLDRLQGTRSGLLGRVAVPAGCADWQAFSEATGIKEKDPVVVTAAGDPWVCQDAEDARCRYAYGVIKPAAPATIVTLATCGEGCPGQPSPLSVAKEDGLWVEVHKDFIRYPNGPDQQLFLLGTRGMSPSTLAVNADWVVLDAAPNIAAWVACSVIECLQDLGSSSAYLAERLWMPTAPGAEETDAADGEEGQEAWPTAAVVSGGGGHSGDPRTPVADKTPPGRGSPEDPGPTPVSILSAHRLFSPPGSASSSVSTDHRTAGHTRSPAVSGARSTADAGIPRSAGSTPGAVPGNGIPAQLTAGLDRDQVEAVAEFLAHPDSGSRVLLQGPPGTGKTETMAAAVLAWLEQRVRHGGPMGPSEQGGVVLLSGPTHTAIDNLLARVGTRLLRAGGLSGGLTERFRLVRLDSKDKRLDSALQELEVLRGLPKRWDKRVWYVVGGTLRHLVKAAKDLRTSVSCHADRKGAALMEFSGRGAFAAALILDEASMMFGPQLLALGCLLVARGSLLVGGDHRQLHTIRSHDFDSDLRPNLVRHGPHVSAFDYLRHLALGEARQRRQAQRQGRQEGGQPEWIGGPPAPVSVSALSYTHRLPAALVALVQPLYRRDGITLRGRPPAVAWTPLVSSPSQPTLAAATPSAQRTATVLAGLLPALAGIRLKTDGGPSRGLASGAGATAAGDALLWQRLWRGAGCVGEAGGEGLFLVIHNEDRSSKLNGLELQLVEALLEARPETGTASGSGGAITQVALITPHRAQRRALAALVQARGWGQDCRVDTVERMQGGEAETVIFCATVSDAAALGRSEEFYSSFSRANVAFSRARRRLIVIASRSFLTHLPVSYARYESLVLWRQLRSMCEGRGTHLGEAYVAVSYSQPPERPPDAVAAVAGCGSTSEEDGVPRAVAGQQGAVPEQECGRRGGDVTYHCDAFLGAV